jgi:hypothetical protein
MKTTLRISILLNCALLTCLASLLLNGWPARNQVEASAEADTLTPVSEAVMPTPVASPNAELKPFRWSQIEAADYPSYIANLRAIGCPEQTIRDIITADVDSLYAARRRPLEQALTASTVTGPLPAEGELRDLRNQETSAVSALLAAPPTATNSDSALGAETPASGSVRQAPPDAGFTSEAVQNIDPSGRSVGMAAPDMMPGFPPTRSLGQKPPATASLPLVFSEVDPSVLTLSPQQAQVVNDLRQKFIAEVGGPNQDPTDPAYSQLWQTSQPEVDVDLWSMLGINAWQAHQMAAWAQAHAQKPIGP